jgi:very-short-patch-repair endonuclease
MKPKKKNWKKFRKKLFCEKKIELFFPMAKHKTRASEYIEYGRKMREMIESLGGQQIGVYKNCETSVECRCKLEHVCFVTWKGLKVGKIFCRVCHFGKEFTNIVESKGGKVIGIYVNSNTRVECICPENHTCLLLPGSVLQTHGICQVCSGNSPIAAKEKFVSRLESFGGIIIGVYINASIKVLCKCVEGHLCLLLPNYVNQGGGTCPTCSGRLKETCEKKFKEIIKQQGGTIVGTYINIKTKVECICSKNHQCFPLLSVLLRGLSMCSKCTGHCSIQAGEKFKKYIESQHGTVVGVYVNNKTFVECLCYQNHTCLVLPNAATRGDAICSMCTGRNPKSMQLRLEHILQQRGYSLENIYVDLKTLVIIKCDKSHYFSILPSSFLKVNPGGFCPDCFPKNVGQTRILNMLKKLQIPFIPEMRIKPSRKKFDFTLTDLNIMIEFDGQQHFEICRWRPTVEDVLEGQQTDRDKMQMAFNNDFRMIRFDYTWTTKDEDIIENAIWHILGIMENDNIVLVLSNPHMYYWLQTDIAFEPQIANMGKELFSAFTLHVWD